MSNKFGFYGQSRVSLEDVRCAEAEKNAHYRQRLDEVEIADRPGTPCEISAIARELNSLNMVLDEVEKLAATLVNRLTPVMNNPSPEPVCRDNQTTEIAPTCSLAGDIRQLRYHAERSAEVLGAINYRLEL